jgi:hypothetical protein
MTKMRNFDFKYGSTGTTGAVTKITKSWKPAVNDCMSLPEL